MAQMNDGMRTISTFDAETAPEEVADSYMRGLAHQIKLTPAYLNRIDAHALRRPGNRLVVLLRNGRVDAGLYAAQGQDNGQPIVWINGLSSYAQASGVAQQLIARAILAADRDRVFGAKIRVMPSGDVNQPAARAFARDGFAASAVGRYAIAANPLDTHLYASAELDGASYRALTLVARSVERRGASCLEISDGCGRTIDGI
ncbi:MAG: hypothetical protein AAGG47_17915 [Pseudomonadota bacterium]